MKYGMRVELCSEIPGNNKIPDGLLDGKLFDIKGIEGTGKENIFNDLKDASRKGVETIVFYYHESYLFNEEQIRRNYHKYLRTSKSKRIQQVYYVVDKKLHKL